MKTKTKITSFLHHHTKIHNLPAPPLSLSKDDDDKSEPKQTTKSSSSFRTTSSIANNRKYQRTQTKQHKTTNNSTPNLILLASTTILGVSMNTIATLTAGVVLAPNILLSPYSLNQIRQIVASTTTTTQNNPKKKKKKKNRSIDSEDGKGSLTAILALFARSQMNLMSNGPDMLASSILTRLTSSSSSSSSSLSSTKDMEKKQKKKQQQQQGLTRNILLDLTRFFRWNYHLTNGHLLFEDDVISSLIMSPLNIRWLSMMHCRTCYFDDCIKAFVQDAIDDYGDDDDDVVGGNVIILGAGYDTRYHRLGLSSRRRRKVRTYEIDAPDTQSEKLRVWDELGLRQQQQQDDDESIIYVSCDFETEDWLDKLNEIKSFNIHLPTIVVWEGVTLYLNESTVIKTLKKISNAGSLWYVAFDYYDPSWVSLPFWQNAMKIVDEPFDFTMRDDEIVPFVTSVCGLQVLEHLRCDELGDRYLSITTEEERGKKNVFGLSSSRVGDFGGFVLAKGTKSES